MLGSRPLGHLPWSPTSPHSHVSQPTLYSSYHESLHYNTVHNCPPLECKLDNGRSHECISLVPSEDGHIVGAQRVFVGSVNTLQESRGCAPEMATSFLALTSLLAGMKRRVQAVWMILAKPHYHLQLTALRPCLSNDPSAPMALGYQETHSLMALPGTLSWFTHWHSYTNLCAQHACISMYSTEITIYIVYTYLYNMGISTYVPT